MTRMLHGLRAPIAAVGLVGLAFAASPANAADDGYANVFTSLFNAVGIIKPDPAPDIAYRERPPLVLPPQPGLPKPVASVDRGAAWPKDPDVLRHRKEMDEARAPRSGMAVDRDDQLSQAELAKGRGVSAGPEPRDCNPNGNNRNCLLVNPDELKAQGDRFAAANPARTDEITAGQEPDRVFLTQPPKGYLRPTKTVKATAEAPIQKVDDANPRSFTAPRAAEE